MKRVLVLGVAAVASAMLFTATAHGRALGSQHVSGMCLQASGSGAMISRCDSGPDQTVEYAGYGQFKINGQCLDSNGERQPLVLRTCNPNDRGQKWAINNNGNLGNEEGWCADIRDAAKNDGAQIIAFKCSRDSNQRWAFRETTAVAPTPAPAPKSASFTLDLSQTLAVSTGPGTYDFYTSDSRKLKLASMDSSGRITVSLPPNFISMAGGSMVASGGGNMVASGGGNVIMPGGISIPMVASGGGNMVASGGGNLVAQGGGNVITIPQGASLAAVVKYGFDASPGVIMGSGSRYGVLNARTVNDLKPQQQASPQPVAPPQAAAPSQAAAPPQASSGRQIKTYWNKCLEASNLAQGTELIQADCNNQSNQRFEFASNGEIRVPNTKLCVDAYGGNSNNNDRIGLWECKGVSNQQWVVVRDQIKGQNSRCMDLVQGSRDNGTKVVLWDCHTGHGQKFGS